MWILTLVLGALVYFLINYWMNSQFARWKKLNIPYSDTSPFKMFFQYIFTKKGLLELMTDDYKKFEGKKFTGYFQMFSPAVMIRDPELVHQVCIKDFSHFVDRSVKSEISDLFTESLGSLTGDNWRTLRHKMTASFTSGKLKMMFDTIKESSDEAVAFIEKKNGQAIEARDFMFKYVINVIGNIAFGLKVDALNEEKEKDNEFLKISRSFFQPSFVLMLKFMITMTMPKVRKYIKFSVVDKKIETFFRKLVHDMIEYREKSGVVRNDFLQLMLDQKKKEQINSELSHPNKKGDQLSTETSAEEPEDKELLDQLKNMQKGSGNYQSAKVFTDECIVSQTFMFISAGSETTAAVLCFVLYDLATNPDLQKKVQKEVDDAISKNGFNYQAIASIKYMEQFMFESMRLHTAAAFLSRVCTENYNIPGTDAVIEKGTFVSLPIIGINGDPLYFHEPQKFDPERFGDMTKLPESLQMGFGSGPRMCIAKRLAMLQMKIVISSILQNFNVTLSKKTTLPLRIKKSSAFQHVEGGVWVQFQKR